MKPVIIDDICSRCGNIIKEEHPSLSDEQGRPVCMRCEGNTKMYKVGEPVIIKATISGAYRSGNGLRYLLSNKGVLIESEIIPNPIAKIQARIEELEQKLIPFLDKHSITEMEQYDRLADLIEENENFLKLFREE